MRVIVVDRRNHHLFQPLLYQVATAALNPSDIAEPIRRVLRHQTNAEVVLAEATGIDVAARTVLLADGVLAYDYLILATGASHSYFGRDDWARFAPGLKSVEDALDIRRRILFAFEAAEREADPARRAAWLRFVVVGAGPTGVELAGALSEIARHALARDFRHIDPKRRTSSSSKGRPGSCPRTTTTSRRRPVSNWSGWASSQHRPDGDGHRRPWGVPRPRADRGADGALGGGGRGLPPGEDPGRPARSRRPRPGRARPDDPRPSRGLRHRRPGPLRAGRALVPGVAPAAIQEAQHAVANIVRTLEDQPRLPFRYRDKGSLATIGRAAGVADLHVVKLSGWVAWVAWLFVHIFFLIGFRNRFIVLFGWAWSYFTYDRGARLITGSLKQLARTHRAPDSREMGREDGEAAADENRNEARSSRPDPCGR